LLPAKRCDLPVGENWLSAKIADNAVGIQPISVTRRIRRMIAANGLPIVRNSIRPIQTWWALINPTHDWHQHGLWVTGIGGGPRHHDRKTHAAHGGRREHCGRRALPPSGCADSRL
jgi:hypothetical protein